MRAMAGGRVACVRTPHLMVQVARRQVKGSRPLLVCQGETVCDACERAASRGVRVGEPLSRALSRCPDARVVRLDARRIGEAWQEALEGLAVHTPTVEDARQGVAYLEARGLGALYGDEGAWCAAVLEDTLAGTALEARMGVAGSRFAAWVAACTAPCSPGFRIVPGDGANAAFLAPLSLGWLPLPTEAARRLHLLGIDTLGQFAALSATAVGEQFGPDALPFHRWARGGDDGPLHGRRRQIVEAQIDFDAPEARREPLLAALERGLRDALSDAQARSLTVQRLTLRLRLFEGESWEHTVWVGETLGSGRLREALERLLDGMRGDADRTNGEGHGVAAARLTVSGLEPATGRQLDLFRHTRERLRFERTLDELARKHPPTGAVAYVRRGHPQACLVADRYHLEPHRP